MKTALSQARTAVRESSSLSANFTLAEPPPCDALLVDLPPVPPVSDERERLDVFRNDSGSAFGGSSSGSAAGAGSARVSSAGGGSAGAGVGARRQ
jgi:uncharacterized membrane protein YgcG